MSLLRILGFSAVLALGACAQSGTAQQAAASGASPRAECAPTQITIYFTEQVASDEPVATPLINDLINRVHACEAAGGELRSITIATSADPGQSPGEAHAQIERRQNRVRAGLINLGAPADKIRTATAAAGAVMGRRADVSADMY